MLPAFLARYQSTIAAALNVVVPPEKDASEVVQRAMRYTLLAPSKRVRAVVTILAGDLCGGGDAIPLAASVELVHAASLILDDLPSMDNAPMRRGRASNHVEFGEATAILASVGLLNLAFGHLARSYPAAMADPLVALLSDSVGTRGLIGGQTEDLLATADAITFERLERIHRLKTGALFTAAATGGALVAGAGTEDIGALGAYAKNLGLAFQIIDDLLDVQGSPTETGKLQRADAKKTTFVSFSGTEGARELARELCQTADQALARFGRRAEPLRELSAFVAGRSI